MVSLLEHSAAAIVCSTDSNFCTSIKSIDISLECAAE